MHDYALEFELLTRPGTKKDKNEDNLVANPSLGIFAVADGMGRPHRNGDVASQLAVQVLEEYLKLDAENDESLKQENLEEAFKAAHQIVLQQATTNPELISMGTTLTAILFLKNNAVIGHVGDSSCFLFSQNKTELISRPQIEKKEERKILTQALGYQSSLEIMTSTISLKTGIFFLLCSDGISDFIESEDITDALQNGKNNKSEACKHLATLAKLRGSQDDQTIAIIEVKPLLK